MNSLEITFGMIVLNGEPFIRYNLRSLYPFAHQIVVVEGACPAAAKVATADGHSRDGTLETLRRFKAEEDPANKLVIVTADLEGHSDGFWTEKDEMSQAYASRATGNYLWQMDSDEFYKPEDMCAVLEMLKSDPAIAEVSFRTLTFWGGLKYKVDGILLLLGEQDFHRLFSWKPGYRYLTHRPPTVVDEHGRNIMNIKNISAEQLAKSGIFLYHYEYLFPTQVHNKAEYYSNAPHCQGLRPDQKWVDVCYMSISKPFGVYNINGWLSWLEIFGGTHPPLVAEMINDVSLNKFPWVSKRHTADIETLLNSKPYAVGVSLLKLAMPFIATYYNLKLWFRALAIKLGFWPYIQRFGSRPSNV